MTTIVPWRRLCAASLLAAALAAHALAQAQTTVYKCVDEHGRIEFTDTGKRGCRPLDLPSTIPAPPQQRSAPPPQRAASVPAAGSAAPASFPRVSSSEQRARDDDRRDILNEELRAEEKKLADLRRDFNNGEPERQGNEKNYARYQARVAQMRDDISRSERNIEALKREISNIR
jgi:hypothetical protein